MDNEMFANEVFNNKSYSNAIITKNWNEFRDALKKYV